MLRRRVLVINKNSTISKSSSLSFVISQQQSTFFTSPTPILRARPEDEERARQWKLPSILTQFLDKTAPAHLRGTYIAEAKGVKQKEEELEKKKKEAEEVRAKKKSAATQAAKVSFTAEERGFVKGGARRSSQKASTEKDNNNAAAAEKKNSKDKYGVNWSNEEIDERATSGGASSSSSSSSTVSFGSNLPRSKQFVEETEEEATDFLAGTQKAKKEQQEAALNKGKKKGKKEPGFFTRAWQTFHMSREDASAVRDEDADNNEAKGLRDDELQTGKYFKKLHKVSLKSWTKQCFQRLPDVEDCKLLNVEVELDPETDIVTVFVTADNLSDKQLTEVKKWVEGICPVSKARDKLLQKMEDEDRKRQSHVLASAGGGVNQFRGNRMTGSGSSSRMVQDPLKQFAKRRNIRWIRIDPDL